jgi:nucleoside-diphosphate-sugar epimerase
MKYLITGGNGFLGRHLAHYFKTNQLNYVTTVRIADGKDQIATGDLFEYSNWSDLFKGIDVVVHTAAKAHDMSYSTDLKKLYQRTNVDLTLQLAQKAKENGVKKFIFISTIKVNGEFTSDRPFRADDAPNPTDDYGNSKLLAETGILKLHQPGVFDVTIIRPCLIYGANSKGNFQSLIKLIKKRYPLPFGRVNNKRSFVSVDNLSDLILKCSTSPQAAGQVFLASDDHDLSFTELILELSCAIGVPVKLLPVPVTLMKWGLRALGRSDFSVRLFSNLQVDVTKTKEVLNWQPPLKPSEAMLRMFSTRN